MHKSLIFDSVVVEDRTKERGECRAGVIDGATVPIHITMRKAENRRQPIKIE
jgi:hypothetical protein